MENLINEDFILKVIGRQILRIEQLSAMANDLQQKNAELNNKIRELEREKTKTSSKE